MSTENADELSAVPLPFLHVIEPPSRGTVAKFGLLA